jgi:chromosome segregation ATPase
MRTNLELRSWWETQRAKAANDLERAIAQADAQVAALAVECDAVERAQERLVAAQEKLESAQAERSRIREEIEVIDDTLQALRDAQPS